MATSLFLLLDDIATVLDDVALLTKVAAKKTAGVLGDDLALNAQQVSGVSANRELPVVWAVAKGSFINKAILVPTALAISAWLPVAVTPLLMVGGAFLCFEGFEKIAHRWLHGAGPDAAHGDGQVLPDDAALIEASSQPQAALLALEKTKIKGAVRTDFILSAEIIAITLGTVQNSAFLTQVTVLTGIAVAMTIGVYGLVAGIVKLDDAGLFLSQRTGEGFFTRMGRSLGRGVLRLAPWLMKSLSVAGTIAMFLVGGGILAHGVPALGHRIDALVPLAAGVAGVGGVLAFLTPLLLHAAIGLAVGALVLLVVELVKKFRMPARRIA